MEGDCVGSQGSKQTVVLEEEDEKIKKRWKIKNNDKKNKKNGMKQR